MNKLYSFIPLFFLLGLGSWAGFASRVAMKSSEKPRGAWRVERGSTAAELGCVDTVWVSLGPDCRFDLTIDIVLRGDFGACNAADFQIAVDDADPLNGHIIDGPGTYRYAIFLKKDAVCAGFEGCWGVVVAEDKTPPLIIPPADLLLDSFCGALELFLNRPSSIAVSGKAAVKDNCAPVLDSLDKFRDEIVYDNQCDTLILHRIFTAKDRAGNAADTFQQITFVRPRLSDIQLKTEVLIDAGCTLETSFKQDAQGNVSPEVTGFPFLVNDLGDTIFLTPGGACGFSADYRDQRFDVCKNAYKIIRRWSILDWCRKSERIIEQHIKIGDIAPPVATCPGKLDTLKISVSPFDCRAALEIPAPIVKDACSDFSWSAEIWVDTVRWAGPILVPHTFLAGATSSGAASKIVAGIPAGCHRLVYKVRDVCGNESSITCRVCISDLISPIAICDDKLQVSLDGAGFGLLSTKDVDEGSRDNCRLAKLEVRRQYTYDSLTCAPATPYYGEWGAFVAFSCCDAGKNVLVELRATDASGNTNTCWTSVWVEDKIAPKCIPPRDTVIDCLNLPVDFSPNDSLSLARLFGNPRITDNCEATFIALPPVVNISQCGSGTIKRRFQALDKFGNRSQEICEQTITIREGHNYTIKFPKDFAYHCDNPQPDFVKEDELGCDILAVYVSEKRYEADGAECYRIFRTFEVINWCEYNGTDQPIVVPRDADCNGIPGDRDIWVVVRPDGKTYYDADADESNANPAAGTKRTTCDGKTNPRGYWIDSSIDPGIQSRGYWRYTQIISVFDNIAPKIYTEKEVVVCSDQPDCSAEIFLSVGIEEVCSQDVEVSLRFKEAVTEHFFSTETDWERYGRFPKYLFAGVIPEGEYLIEIRVSDGCRNVATQEVKLRVVDCNDPVPICYDGLSTQLMPMPAGTDADGDGLPDQGAATVWVKDFLKDAFEGCSFPLRYSINRVGEPVDINKTSLVLTCKDKGLVPVEVHVWDNAKNPHAIQPDGSKGGRNHSYCTTYILVQDDQFKTCEVPIADNVGISGALFAENGAPLAGAEVQLNGAAKRVASTNEKGAYTLEGLSRGYDYSLTPQRSETAGAGVTTLDLILVTQHILGVRKLSSPYQMIAADVNLSKSITTLDLILMRRLILNVDNQFAHGRSWRFIDAGFKFPDPGSPWKSEIPEGRSINNIQETIRDANFVAVKLGDINNSAPAFQNRASIQPRTGIQASLVLPDLDLMPGQEIEIPLTLHMPGKPEGCQFALQVDRDMLEIEEAVSGLAGLEHINASLLPEGLLLLSWNASGGTPVHTGTPLIVLKARAKRQGALSGAVQLETRYLAPEGYLTASPDPQVLALGLQFTRKELQAPVLYPPVPNPALQQTLLRWQLPQDAEVRLVVRDAWGRICFEHRETQPKGEHRLELGRARLPASGLYFVTLEADRHVFSQKVIFLD